MGADGEGGRCERDGVGGGPSLENEAADEDEDEDEDVDVDEEKEEDDDDEGEARSATRDGDASSGTPLLLLMPLLTLLPLVLLAKLMLLLVPLCAACLFVRSGAFGGASGHSKSGASCVGSKTGVTT